MSTFFYSIAVLSWLMAQPSRAIDWKEPTTIRARQRGLQLEGIIQRMSSDKIFLTFDLCQTGFDDRIVNFLTVNNIPATFFLTASWIEKHPENARQLSENPLFSIQNHGALHLPCFSEPGSAYGIKGTNGPQEIVEEIEKGGQSILHLTHHQPEFYRSGTAHYDDVCVHIAKELGYQIAGFAINGDAGATYTKQQVTQAILAAKPGDIVLLHASKPKSGTYDGLINAIEQLKKKHIEFDKL